MKELEELERLATNAMKDSVPAARSAWRWELVGKCTPETLISLIRELKFAKSNLNQIACVCMDTDYSDGEAIASINRIARELYPETEQP